MMKRKTRNIDAEDVDEMRGGEVSQTFPNQHVQTLVVGSGAEGRAKRQICGQGLMNGGAAAILNKGVSQSYYISPLSYSGRVKLGSDSDSDIFLIKPLPG